MRFVNAIRKREAFTSSRASHYLFMHSCSRASKLASSLSAWIGIAHGYRGDKGIRTLDPLLARQVLSQLSYTPISRYRQNCFYKSNLYISQLFLFSLVGLNGLEPSTSRLSGVRSNQLSYNPLHTVLYISQSADSFLYKSGSHLLSHTVSSIVSSAA